MVNEKVAGSSIKRVMDATGMGFMQARQHLLQREKLYRHYKQQQNMLPKVTKSAEAK